MKHYYLVDSENVNDNWLLLLDAAEPSDEIIVFYTKNSPHMGYASVIKLVNATFPVKFIEAFEGTNALDFQLVSFMGYLIRMSEGTDCEFDVMTNDTGFDAAVRFWRENGVNIKRINVNYCKQMLAAAKPAVRKEVKAAAAIPEETAPEIAASEKNELPSCEAPSSEEQSAPVSSEFVQAEPVLPVSEFTAQESSSAEEPVCQPECPEEPEKPAAEHTPTETEIIYTCFGKNNLSEIHQSLVAVFGSEEGGRIYKTVKDSPLPSCTAGWNKTDKFTNYTKMVFAKSQYEEPDGFSDFILKNIDKCSNLNAIRPVILKKYGNDMGMKYYSLFKAHLKLMVRIK